MSFSKHMGPNDFPDQDKKYLGKKVVVFFQFDTGKPRMGKVIRHDKDAPGESIIEMEDGRFILGRECTFKLAVEADG